MGLLRNEEIRVVLFALATWIRCSVLAAEVVDSKSGSRRVL